MNIKGFIDHLSVLANILVVSQGLLLICKIFYPLGWITVLSPIIILFFIMVYMCLFIDRNAIKEIAKEVERQSKELDE
jgi:predicted acyltransferase (DUF342 family)